MPVLNVDRRLEVKRRARAYGTTYTHLGANYALIKRDDQSEWLVTMRLKDLAQLALGETGEKS